ncbi:MAG: nucleotidyl transferase AbiEii/AbiGii toxin family protein [Candidatus Micrarchaeota archaeon]
MISRKELESAGRSLGFNAYQAEKDYLQHAFLASLYSVSEREFVFKGGTALQKAFGLDRFSEDLDFTLVGKPQNAQALIQAAVADFGKFAEADSSKDQETADSFSVKLKAKGPLFGGSERSSQTILLEVSKREVLLKAPAARRVVPPYADLRAYVALCMDLDEQLAEKVRAIMTREKARDVYDAWFLVRKKAVFNKHDSDAKLSYYGKKFEFKEFKKAVLKKQKAWDKELRTLFKTTPVFTETSGELLKAIETICT